MSFPIMKWKSIQICTRTFERFQVLPYTEWFTKMRVFKYRKVVSLFKNKFLQTSILILGYSMLRHFVET